MRGPAACQLRADRAGGPRRLRAETPAGEAWRCLRCGTFVPGPPAASGPAAAAPRVRRDDELRSALILRAFAVERFLRGVVFGFIAYGIWRFKYSRLSVEHTFNREYPEVRSLLHELGYNIDRSGLVGLIRHTFTLDQRTLTWLAIGAAAYTVVEFLEAIALWGLTAGASGSPSWSPRRASRTRSTSWPPRSPRSG